jgi:ethanolamine utilization protein EutA (predicted chaperonin)
MSEQEFCNWLALCNALKFINSTSELTGKIIDEKDIDYREMINYISTVSGDISTCLKEKQGVPFKYSLDTRLKESLEIEDLNYEFLDN